jgi:hypothetical protein
MMVVCMSSLPVQDARERARQKQAHETLQMLADDRVMTFSEWCEVIQVSPATGRRILTSGNGPVITRLSARRFGIRGRHHRAWLDSRAEGGK